MKFDSLARNRWSIFPCRLLLLLYSALLLGNSTAESCWSSKPTTTTAFLSVRGGSQQEKSKVSSIQRDNSHYLKKEKGNLLNRNHNSSHPDVLRETTIVSLADDIKVEEDDNDDDDDEQEHEISTSEDDDDPLTDRERKRTDAHEDEDEDSENEKQVIINDDLIDVPIQATFIAETNLPTDVGSFRLRAYRVLSRQSTMNPYLGLEPCVIYCADKPPFGTNGQFAEGVPIRVHDQCVTSEVFRSQRYVFVW